MSATSAILEFLNEEKFCMSKCKIWFIALFLLDDFDVKTRRTRIKRLLSMTSLLPKML